MRPAPISSRPLRALRRPLRLALEAQCAEGAQASFFENDPVQFVHRYADPRDQEVVGLLAAFLAFGRVQAFLPKIRALLDHIGPSPREYIRNFRRSSGRGFLDAFRSRVYSGEDLRILLCQLRAVLAEYSTLEDAFLCAPGGSLQSHRGRLASFASLFYRAPGGRGSAPFPSSYRHLVADPSRGGACKRWNLYLRWMVRPPDGVDLGIWRRVDPSVLVMPLDVHVGRISGLLGLRTRRTLDWKAAEEITAALRSLDALDPLRFDFALSHLGISSGCRGRRADAVCRSCALRAVCTVAALDHGEALA